MRWVFGIEYDGSAYHGWQSQQNPPLITLQTCIERAISQVAAHPIHITCAGRTDRGVHALGQVIHFDSTAQRSAHAWCAGSNHYLPDDIRVLWAQLIDDEFHARFSAVARRYQYIIYNHSVRPAILRQKVSWFPIPLDAERMQSAGNFLLGEHDFSAFRAADCQAKTTMRRIEHLQIQRHGHFLILEIQANAFLHHMVRNIVGVLQEIGIGKREPSWAAEVLQGRQRSLGGVTADPSGLYLSQVFYPQCWNLSAMQNPVLLPLQNLSHKI